MQTNWNDYQPIYRQLRERVIALILDGVLDEGEALPSVRNVSSEFRVNPITVSKAYQTLVEDNLVEKKRGLGMFVQSGAKEMLLESEKKKFLEQEWPAIISRIHRLGLSTAELLSLQKPDMPTGGA
ncbi:MAG: GntR family transcriptional regulator [Gammaproteobacteria bacterium]|nr:MAG: GntR family transcriptional regulator [Gammaproteobacteria bacterium]